MTAPHINPARIIASAEEAARYGTLNSQSSGVVRRNRNPRPVDRQVWGLEPEVLKPEWNSFPPSEYSNTAGSGESFRPRREDRVRRNRVRSNSRVSQQSENLSWFARFQRRADNVMRSPGGFAVSLGGLILTVGLSPLVVNDEPTPQNSTPPAIATVSVEESAAR